MTRFAPFALLATWLIGCYAPHFASPGFFCNPDDKAGCPVGQVCASGRCVDSTATVAADMSITHGFTDASMSGATDLAAGADMSVQPDLSMAACRPTGGDCTYHQDKVCCSKYCVYSTNKCK